MRIRFCYHCRIHHPEDLVRRVQTRIGVRWRCHKSIRAASSGREERDAFGRQVSERNRTENVNNGLALAAHKTQARNLA